MTKLDPKALEAAFIAYHLHNGLHFERGIQAYLEHPDADLVPREDWQKAVNRAQFFLDERDKARREADDYLHELADERVRSDDAFKQLAALREAMSSYMAGDATTDYLYGVLADTDKAAAQWVRRDELAQMLIDVSERPIPNVMASVSACGSTVTRQDVAAVAWTACFQDFERRIKTMLAAPNPEAGEEG